jgi:hypothetical protein
VVNVTSRTRQEIPVTIVVVISKKKLAFVLAFEVRTLEMATEIVY